MIIIITFPFFAFDNGFIGIEEPELFIHPGLQKRLLNFLLNHTKTKNFQIFLSSHSNHVLDAVNFTDKISIFAFSKALHKKKNNTDIEVLPDFILENVAYGNENILNLLGVTNTSVYLSNCTIWVEGITDKLYLQKIIDQYLSSNTGKEKYSAFKRLQEGVNYSFVLTAGDSIVHWDFSDESEYHLHKENVIVRKFCGKSLLIVDNDFGKNTSRKNKLTELLGDRFITLAVPEIENLLSINQIKQTILEYPSVTKAFKTVEEFPSIEETVIKDKKIGFVIDQLLLKNVADVKHFSQNGEQGSLRSNDKLDFCKKAIKHIKPEGLTNEAISLTEKILDFIIEQNKNFITA